MKDAHLITFLAILFAVQAGALAASVLGIDVSDDQGTISWSQVYNAGYRFAFARASLGDENPPVLNDANFVSNMINGRAAGMLMGAYHFAYPDYGTDPNSEARHFLNVAGGYLTEGYLRPVLDLERGSSLGKTALSKWVTTWINTVKSSTGIEPIIYTDSDYAQNYLDASLNQYDVWIADWTCSSSGSPLTGIWSSWDFWQYYGPGYCGPYFVPGIGNNVDIDVFNGTLSSLTSQFVIGQTQDTTPPTISAFSVSSTSVTVGSPVTISYTASDTGGSGLKTAELWRAPDDGYGVPGTWKQIGSSIDISAGGNGPFQGSFSDTPPLVGEWWYGVHVVDGAGNWNDERNSQSGGAPGVFGPIQVTVMAGLPAPPTSSPGDTSSPGPVLATTQPTFMWTAVAGAASYGLYIDDLTLNQLYVYNPSAGTTSYQIPANVLHNGDVFSWWMTTFSGSTEGSQGSYRYFQTSAVNQTLTMITVDPATIALNPGDTQQFTATGHDQFGNLLVQQPPFTWTTTLGSISTSGLLTAPNTSANVTVTATSGMISGVATVTVNSLVLGDFSWQYQSSMPQALINSLGAVLDGKIHVVGGNIGNAHYCYDPSTNAWTTLASVPSPVNDGGAAVVNSKLYAIGYWITSITEIYDPSSNTWSTGAMMPTPRDYPAVVATGGKVYAIGGWGSGGPVGIVEVYDPTTNTWASCTAMPTPRGAAAVVSLGGLIYVIGGSNGNPSSCSVLEVYNPATDTWASKSPMSTKRIGAAAVVVGGKIFMLGGYDGGQHYLASVEEYNPDTDSWHILPSSLLTPRGYAVGGVVNGSPYIIGGYSGNGYLATIEKGTARYQTIPTITWATPASITYGTALSSTQLNAQASVGGTYAYSWNIGMVPTAGWHTLSVTFTPYDTTDYTAATASVWLWVNQAKPTISWATPAAITYGTPLSSTQLNASASWSVGGTLVTVVGVFTYMPLAGTVLDTGNKTLYVTFTPTDTDDYTTATASVQITVNVVNFTDYAIFANHWMDDTCSDPDWCEGTDFDHSGGVDILDLATFAEYWLSGS